MTRTQRRYVRAILAAIAAASVVVTSACSRDPEVAKRKYLESGDRFFEQEKYSEAIIEYRNAIRLDPKFAAARKGLAASYLRTSDLVNALREKVRVADLLPEDGAAQVEAGNLLLLVGRYDDAKARASKVLSGNPKDIGAQLLLANALAGLKDFDGAIAEVEEALKLDPERTSTYTSLGTLQLARGNREAAERAFKEATARNPTSVAAQLAYANFQWAIGEVQAAKARLEQALVMAPKDSRANRAMASLLLAGGETAAAEPYLIAAADTDPTLTAMLVLADYYIAANRTADAVARLRQLESKPTLRSSAKLRLASIEFRQGRHSEAERLADEILTTDKGDTRALLLKANVLAIRNQLDEAAGYADRAAKADPRSARAQFALGRLALLRHKPEEARTAFTEAVRLNPRAGDAQLELARLHLAEGAAAKSLEFANQAAKNEPDKAEPRLAQARALIAQRQLDSAELVLDQVLKAYPRSAEALTQLGIVRTLRRDVVRAAPLFERALEIDPLRLEATAGLVSLDLAARRHAEARARAEARLASTPGDSAALLLAGRTYSAVGDVKAAEDTLKKAIEADPQNLGAYETLGRLYMAGGRLKEAQAEFEAIAARQSRPIGSLTMVGMIQQGRKLAAEARSTYERVLQFDSKAAIAANNLAWIYLDSGENLDLALQLAQTAKASRPTQPEITDTLGWIYYRKGLFPQAVRELEGTVQSDPANPLYQYHLGLAYAKTGDKVRAKRTLEAALRLKPDFDGAADAARVLSTL